MNLNYDRIRAKVEHGGNHWTSYSDLFLVLSVVFLLLYVVANLRTSTMSFASATQLQLAKQEAEELKKQIKAYEVVRDDYIKEGASNDEIVLYRELMGKLDLLENEAREKRDLLFKEAKEAQEKEATLNRYQAMVKNIISANLVAQSKLKKRDETIEEKQFEIIQQERNNDELNHVVQSKAAEIDKNNQTIAQIGNQLEQQIKEVQYAYRSKKRSKEKLEEAVSRLKQESSLKIDALRKENAQVAGQLESTRAQVEAKNREAEQLVKSLSEQEGKYKEAIAALNQSHNDGLVQARKAYEEGMHHAQISADAQLKQEQAYRTEVERRNQVYNEKLKGLNGELETTRKDLAGVAQKYQNSLNSLEKMNQGLKRDLADSIQKQNAQRDLAERIKKSLAKTGVDADVDMNTGDVTIRFANEYFDTGSAALKEKMKDIIEKMMPVYAGSLFHDDKVAKKIASVEIVGFASPTYQGKYVNPDSLSPEDRSAVNYNMDLSYQRAKSIFEYVFDTRKMTFTHQKTLLPLVKVSGRSYLATERVDTRSLASMPDDRYCRVYDCKKSQKVIIRFSLKD